MEMMEVDEPLSSLEAQRAPALDTEEGLLIPVAGPETPCRPTSGMPGLTPTGEHVTALQFDGERFYNGDRALKVKRWLHRVAEDASGLTFEEWDPTKDVDNSQPPVPMIINSSELRGAGFNLQEVIPPALEAAARSGRRTRGAGVRQVEGLGRKRFVLSADDDNDLRSRCE